MLELGCGTDLLTRELRERADRVTAVDLSARALQVARFRGLDRVEWVQGRVPEAMPAGEVDLVVFSELAYFLSPAELLATLRALRQRLAPGGELALVDWRRPTRDIPLDGELVHELVRHSLGLPAPVRYQDQDPLVEVFTSADSVAEREGLT